MTLSIKGARWRFSVIALYGFIPLLSMGSAAFAQSSGSAQSGGQVAIG
jgi:hypothetical protein